MRSNQLRNFSYTPWQLCGSSSSQSPGIWVSECFWTSPVWCHWFLPQLQGICSQNITNSYLTSSLQIKKIKCSLFIKMFPVIFWEQWSIFIIAFSFLLYIFPYNICAQYWINGYKTFCIYWWVKWHGWEKNLSKIYMNIINKNIIRIYT